ncbi:MAG TPA: RES family NAD+ phosphorylase [Bryobacteraceae bacterium]|nr:RES family NAD+ phosphorylase [Bryobacteraceae bacterium]
MAFLRHIHFSDTHRLIPAKYSKRSVLESLGLPADAIADLSELDAATNERKLGEAGANPAIGRGELLYGVPEAHIVNAAFLHPGSYGGRFHTIERGAWYAGAELETSVAEVTFHKRRFLRDARISGRYSFDYQDFIADFSGNFHHLDKRELKACRLPDPIPQCYSASQILANSLLYEGSNGIVYPSVRRLSGTCIACFRPALVFHPHRGREYRITLEAGSDDMSYRAIRERQ